MGCLVEAKLGAELSLLPFCVLCLTLACQHVRGVLLVSLMLWRPELYRLSLKPCPVGPGIMNIRTLPFYVNTY